MFQGTMKEFYKCENEIREMFQKRYSLQIHNFRDAVSLPYFLTNES